MVRLSDLIDLNEDGTKRTFRHGGLEAPRDRLEQPTEAFHSFLIDALCTSDMTTDWPQKNCYVKEAPMKKLISEEFASRPSTRQNAPSVVARLMGMDTLSLDTKPSREDVEKRNEMRKGSFDRVAHSPGQNFFDSFDQNEAINFDRRSGSLKLDRLKPREHPQEEELQKFKKDFEAWQATRFKDTDQWQAQQHLNKEKLIHHTNLMRKRVGERPEELKGHAITNPHEICILKLQRGKNDCLAAVQNKTNCARNVKSNLEFQQPLSTGSSRRVNIASAPTKIVILKPVPDRMWKNKESWTSSPGISEDGSSIEEFLHEIKERLKCELRGQNFRRSITARRGRTETSYTEKPSEAKHIAQCIAKQARERVTRDIGTTLPRLESMRSHRSEIQCEDTGSPEFTYKGTRRFSTGRLRNDTREEASHDIRKHRRGSSVSAIQNKETTRAEEIRCTSNNVRHGGGTKDEPDMQSKYFRHEGGKDATFDQELFHRTLVRSLSAPVSRTTFGKLLLEDRHMLTGGHIRRKHEASEKVSVSVKKWRKEKFNLKEKVTRFKYSFVLRGRIIFGRKMQSLDGNKQNHTKDLPTVASKIYDRQENSDEVPPSPASECSTTNEGCWRQTEYCSPSSTSDVHPLDDSEMPNVFKEISSNLNELRRKLNQLETYDSEETVFDDQPVEEEEIMEIDNPAEAFIRDLLVASGLYDGSCDKHLSKWDPLGKPISNQVFEEVKESYKQKRNDQEASTNDQLQKLNLKLLCDFMNEVLPSVLGVPSTSYSFMARTIGPASRPPRGKKLLDCVWEIVRVYVYPPSDMLFQSLETILAGDVQSAPWAGLVDEDVNAIGKDIEYHIIGDLIDEMVNEMQS